MQDFYFYQLFFSNVIVILFKDADPLALQAAFMLTNGWQMYQSALQNIF